MSLRLKFNLVMVGVGVLGMLVAAMIASQFTATTARAEVLQQASLLMQQAIAIRSFTSKEVAPLLAEQSTTRFLPHTVPSFAAQSIVRTVRRDFLNYDYKEAALNPTNPADRATDWETDIINLFRQNASLMESVSERPTASGPILTLARPFRITDPSCLACHSTPSAAPVSMIDLYGPSNGFGWKMGEAIGAQIVSVPMSVPFARANAELSALLSGLGCVFFLMFLFVNLLLHMVVLRPIQRMTKSAERIAEGAMNEPELLAMGRDEIASLGRSFNLMRRSLAKAIKLLEA